MRIENVSKILYEENKKPDNEYYLPFIFYNHGWEIVLLDAKQIGMCCAVQVMKDDKRYICYGGGFIELLDNLKKKKNIPTNNVKKLVNEDMVEKMFNERISAIQIDIKKG